MLGYYLGTLLKPYAYTSYAQVAIFSFLLMLHLGPLLLEVG